MHRLLSRNFHRNPLQRSGGQEKEFKSRFFDDFLPRFAANASVAVLVYLMVTKVQLERESKRDERAIKAGEREGRDSLKLEVRERRAEIRQIEKERRHMIKVLMYQSMDQSQLTDSSPEDLEMKNLKLKKELTLIRYKADDSQLSDRLALDTSIGREEGGN